MHLTIVPLASAGAHDFTFVLFVVDNSSDGQTQDVEARSLLGSVVITLLERVDSLWRGDRDLQLTPRFLSNAVRVLLIRSRSGETLTFLVLSSAPLTSSQQGPMMRLLMTRSSKGEVLVPKT